MKLSNIWTRLLIIGFLLLISSSCKPTESGVQPFEFKYIYKNNSKYKVSLEAYSFSSHHNPKWEIPQNDSITFIWSNLSYDAPPLHYDSIRVVINNKKLSYHKFHTASTKNLNPLNPSHYTEKISKYNHKVYTYTFTEEHNNFK